MVADAKIVALAKTSEVQATYVTPVPLYMGSNFIHISTLLLLLGFITATLNQ